MAKAYRWRKKHAAALDFAIASGRALRGIASAEELALVAAHRRCAQCGMLMPSGRRADALYCRRACKAKASRARRKAAQSEGDHDA
ncbi:hypothetical protein ACIBHX_46525 [Nonomuraea sp. NPDC050536]|uniref:hypothetical protein n=1 Tax=Nonomuraea sp. NPDC050536 TaxID=3364366 RepID=UPI0037C7E0ED